MLIKMTFRATLITLCTMLSVSAHAIADAPRRVDIPAGELSDALLKLSKQYGVDLVYRPEQVYGLKTRGAHGSLTTEQAVTQLLQGTVLELRTDQSGAMLIAPPVFGSAQATGSAPQASTAHAHDASDAPKEGKKSSSDDFRVAQVDQGKGSSASSVGSAISNSHENSSSPTAGLAEIVVTAQKRSERLLDVPVPVSVIEADTLVATNQLRLQDYFTSVPGINLAPNQTSGEEVLAIRGLTTGGGTNPTVGITIDDVPYGASTYLGGFDVVPELDPSDLARVEVLRGPQGTLYGASSLGGVIKFVTIDPSMDGMTGRIEAGTSSVHNAPDWGYNFRGSANVPLSDTLAVRASGFVRQDPGYIDNVQTGQRGVNKADFYGGRLAALWRPSDTLSIKVSALYQDAKQDGSSDVDKPLPGYGLPPLGDLQQSYLPGTGGYERKTQGYSATISAKLGITELTAVSGYNINEYSDLPDNTYSLGPVAQQVFNVPGSPIKDLIKIKKFSQELRASTPIGQSVDWLLGAFYTHETSNPVMEDVFAANQAGQVLGLGLAALTPNTYQEYAVFTDFTLRFSDRFNVQIGGRESEIRQSLSSTFTGPYVPIFLPFPSSPVVYPEVDSKANAFTYLVTPQLKFSPDLMVYARLASGYRPGGPNNAPGVPRHYDPDRTKNYEIGLKGDFLNHSLAVEASVYYIDWTDLQLSLTLPTGFGFVGNGGSAKSEGVEFSVNQSRCQAWRSVPGLLGRRQS